MQQLMPRWAIADGPALGQLSEVLGHYHDLVILDALLHRQADELNVDVHLRSMRNAVRNATAEFASEGLALGARAFARPVAASGNVVEIGKPA
jgi:hypothetical protein